MNEGISIFELINTESAVCSKLWFICTHFCFNCMLVKKLLVEQDAHTIYVSKCTTGESQPCRQRVNFH